MTARDNYLRRVYGITEHQYKEILQKQEGRCGVCRRLASVFRIRLAVDHDHKTGEIRGALCVHCNRRVIGRHRDPELFRRAAEYLSQGTGWFVPPKKKKRRKRKASPARVRK